MAHLLGYLSQPSRVMTLYGYDGHFEYFATHESHPSLKLRIGVSGRPLKDREEVKVPGYVCPFKVNLYESARCCPSSD